MITVLLQNRLGNILFQYALGRHLEIRNGRGLRLDAFSYVQPGDPSADGLRRLLEGFDLKAEIHAPSRRRLPVSILPYRLRKRLKELYLRRAYGTSRLYVEIERAFDPTVLDLADGAVLYGFFQSEKYFRDIASVLREDLRFHGRWSDGLLERFAETIPSTSSVSVHVRRGDYLKLPGLPVCSAGYYERAVRYIQERVERPRFLVFSDDLPWCIRNLRIPECEYPALGLPSPNPFDEMRLMRLCRHHITANSTFSWWPAWLGSDPGRIVTAPATWFADTGKNTVAMADLIPREWRKIVC